MKKLMIATAIVCAAAFSQAATAIWDTKASTSTQVFNTNVGGTEQYSGTAYLYVLTSSVTQDSILTAWRTSGSSALTGYATDLTINDSGKLVEKVWSNTATSTDGEGKPNGKQSFFIVVDNGDNLFLGETVTANETANDAGALIGIKSSVASKKFNDGTAAFAGTSGKGAGWYASVPEPTSGLLLLLGMAGLALRRRRA